MAAAAPPAPISIRERVAAQGARIKRVKRLDRLAVGVITAGGLSIIVAVLFIFVFILGEALPLFRPAAGEPKGTVDLAAVPEWGEATPPSGTTPAAPGSGATLAFKPLVLGIDEYQMYIYEVLADGRTVFFKAKDGSFVKQMAATAAVEAGIASASRSLQGEYVALGTRDGRAILQQVRFTPRYEEQKLADLDLALRQPGSRGAGPGPAAPPRGGL